MRKLWRQAQGSWCSGITPAQHAGGPGFNPQSVHGGVEGNLLARSEKCDLWHGQSKSKVHQPGIEPGSHRWQRCILPLDH